MSDVVSATRALVHDHLLPLEEEFGGDITAAGGDAMRVRLQDLARDAGVYGPHLPTRYGGQGMGLVDRAPVFEEAGYSLFGPIALNIGAPDEGNAHLLEVVGTTQQKERFLEPLARGEHRSAFAMTEPAPGAGSDPSALATTARRVDGGWVVDGSKKFITGADGAGFLIVMARTPGGATMFLTESSAEGIEVGRHVPTMDRSMIGGHCEVRFSGLFVPDDGVLGAVDEGFRHAQVRLGPARMTHVMRWLGAARRAHEVAVEYAVGREAFGTRLSDLGMAQQMIADNEIDLEATRALMLRACRLLDAGDRASRETSIAKTFAAEALDRIVDRSMQLCGGAGVSDDLPIARIAREIRPFRVYDGPSEVHRWSIARRAVRRICPDA